MSTLRLEKINELLREELGRIFHRDTHLKTGVFVTITKVRTSPNLKESCVFISVFPEQETEYAMTSLTNELYKLQGLLNRRLFLRPIPRILLERDNSERNAQAVEDRLEDLKKEARQKKDNQEKRPLEKKA